MRYLKGAILYTKYYGICLSVMINSIIVSSKKLFIWHKLDRERHCTNCVCYNLPRRLVQLAPYRSKLYHFRTRHITNYTTNV